MKLFFSGHDDRYAIEQSLLTFFPQERPVYDEPRQEGDAWAEVRLSRGKVFATARTTLFFDGKETSGTARWKIDPTLDAYETEREQQKILKLSFFHAAQKMTGATPAWGALTGIRPAKLATRLIQETGSQERADQVLKDVYQVSESRRRLCLESAEESLRAQQGLNDRQVSLYIGIPFCPTRCAYCSFVSNSVERSFSMVEPYVQALKEEIRMAGELVRDLGLEVRSFYMGGGTPTTLTAEQMDQVLTELENRFDLSRMVEHTVEAGRPDTITEEKLRVLKDHGVTRVSINPQSMEDKVLQAIGRRHRAEEILQAMELVHRIGFSHINMDMIAGLPEDSPEGFARSLDKVLTLGADNITVHTLSLKKGSRIMLEGSKIPSADDVARMLEYADPTLRRNGFHPYYLYRQKYMSGNFENVGWCQTGAEGLYNIYIMEELQTILSMGAGGSTKMVRGNRIERVFNCKYPKEYMERPEKIKENHAAFRRFYEEV